MEDNFDPLADLVNDCDNGLPPPSISYSDDEKQKWSDDEKEPMKKKKKKQNKNQDEGSNDDWHHFEYEVEGAPWWMPVDETIKYESKIVIDPSGDNILNMDSVKIVVNDNPWLQHIADKGEDKRQYVLSIDFQVNCRKYILFTSLLLFIVIMTFISSIYTGFYEWRGYIFNLIVTVILMYGIFVGFVCTEMNRYKTRTVLALLNIYWSLAWIAIICLFITAGVYLILFPNKFRNYCSKREICDGGISGIIFAEMSLISSLFLYIFMMFFYMQRIANLVIVISNLRDYELKYESNWFMRKCHKHNYRYLRGWKAFRTIITQHTGLRLADILYCSCWFKKCRRSSSTPWKPFRKDKDKKKQKDKKKDKEKEKKKEKKRKDSWDIDWNFDCGYDYNYQPNHQREQCWHCCDNVNHYGSGGDGDEHCWCCRDCVLFCDYKETCHGCTECMGDICSCCDTYHRYNNCCSCCCDTYHTDNVGECNICCKSVGDICGCCDCCDDCKCNDCDGGGEAVVLICGCIIIAIICIVVFLLPIIVFGCIAAPFWLLTQYLVWKLNDKVSWCVVVSLFIIFLIPPCIIWAYLWTAICLGNVTNTFMTVMCLIWSFFHTIYSSLG